MSEKKKYDGIEFYQVEEKTAKSFANRCSLLLSQNYIFTSPPQLVFKPDGGTLYTQQWMRKDGEKIQFDVVPE